MISVLEGGSISYAKFCVYGPTNLVKRYVPPTRVFVNLNLLSQLILSEISLIRSCSMLSAASVVSIKYRRSSSILSNFFLRITY